MKIQVGEYEVELKENYDLREDCECCETLASYELLIAKGRAVACEDEGHQQRAAAEAVDRAHAQRMAALPNTY